MTLDACAELVRKSDPDRFAATMAAPPAVRARLWPLYAYNLELARSAWASAEPMICQMRLQWWIDTTGAMGPGAPPRAHEVAAPLQALVAEARLPVTLLAGMAEARIWDTEREAFADRAAFDAYLDATAGNLMWLAALALGAPPAAEPAVRDFAWGAGLANWFCAVAELVARGRQPLPAPVTDLARDGLDRIARARAARATIPRAAAPALFPGWQAEGLLTQAAREPDRITAGRLGLSEFRKRGSLLWRAVTGRW